MQNLHYCSVKRDCHFHLGRFASKGDSGYTRRGHRRAWVAGAPPSSWASQSRSPHLPPWTTDCAAFVSASIVLAKSSSCARRSEVCAWSYWLSWRPSAPFCGESEWSYKLEDAVHYMIKTRSRRLGACWLCASRCPSYARLLSFVSYSSPFCLYFPRNKKSHFFRTLS